MMLVAFGLLLDGQNSCRKAFFYGTQENKKENKELKKRQKNFSRQISEEDGLLWDFGAVKKALDALKLPLRSLQHIKDENLWLEKGTDICWEKIRELMSAVQDLITLTEIYKFKAIDSSLTENMDNIGMRGNFPSDLPEIEKRPQIPKPVPSTLPLYKTNFHNLS